MSGDTSRYYCDEATHGALQACEPRVLLVGSYGGFSNFGDILQLKGALAWHRKHSKLDPVLVCHLTAVPDADFVNRVRCWFGCRHVLFWCSVAADVAALGLRELNESARIAHLHVYGGGFLNRYWGTGTIQEIESLIARFGVGHYVISGQQIDEAFVPALREHFGRFRPLLAGGRDRRSAQLLANLLSGESAETPDGSRTDAFDSFDDAIDPLRQLSQTGDSGDREHFDLALHLNLSYYTGSDDLQPVVERLQRVAEFARNRTGGRSPRVLLLNAYADRRIEEVIDTLSAVNLLENDFPFDRAEVLQLGQLALTYDLQPATHLFRASLAVSSSYHVSMMCGLMGIPCHLLARNAYYEQKRDGLGISGNFDEFLTSPVAADFSRRIEQRRRWLGRMEEVYRQPAADAIQSRSEPLAGVPWPWRAKPRLIDSLRSEVGHWRDQFDGLRQRMDRETKEGEELRNQVSSIKQCCAGLESECQLLKSNIAKQEQQIRELVTSRSWLNDQREGLLASEARLLKTVSEQTAWTTELQTGKDWVEQQWRQAEATIAKLLEDCKRLQAEIVARDRTLEECRRTESDLREQIRTWKRQFAYRAMRKLSVVRELMSD